MCSKKGKKGKGKGKSKEKVDNPTANFLPAYEKAWKENGVTPSKSLVTKVEQIMNEGEDLNEILVNEKLGELGARALAIAYVAQLKEKKVC